MTTWCFRVPNVSLISFVPTWVSSLLRLMTSAFMAGLDNSWPSPCCPLPTFELALTIILGSPMFTPTVNVPNWLVRCRKLLPRLDESICVQYIASLPVAGVVGRPLHPGLRTTTAFAPTCLNGMGTWPL